MPLATFTLGLLNAHTDRIFFDQAFCYSRMQAFRAALRERTKPLFLPEELIIHIETFVKIHGDDYGLSVAQAQVEVPQHPKCTPAAFDYFVGDRTTNWELVSRVTESIRDELTDQRIQKWNSVGHERQLWSYAREMLRFAFYHPHSSPRIDPIRPLLDAT